MCGCPGLRGTQPERWGIKIEWDEKGLECCTWYRILRGSKGRERVEFGTEAGAQQYIDLMALALDTGTDVVTTPQRIE